MGDWLADMTRWDVFGTLTYDPKRCRLIPGRRDGERSMPGMDEVKRHAYRWLRRGPFAVGQPVQAAVVGIERHKSGWPHMHTLLKFPTGVQKGLLSGMGQAWFAEHGYAKLELPRSRDDVAIYVAKYVSKDIDRGDILFFRCRDLVAARQRQAAS
jgi:hypothetical protein